MGKRGPQAKPRQQRKGAPTGIRFDPTLKEQLEGSALANKRTFSEEITIRLQRSLRVSEISTLEREGASNATIALSVLIGASATVLEQLTGKHWQSSAYTHNELVTAVSALLASFKPTGETICPDQFPILQDKSISPETATQVRLALKNDGAGKSVAEALLTEVREASRLSGLALDMFTVAYPAGAAASGALANRISREPNMSFAIARAVRAPVMQPVSDYPAMGWRSFSSDTRKEIAQAARKNSRGKKS